MMPDEKGVVKSFNAVHGYVCEKPKKSRIRISQDLTDQPQDRRKLRRRLSPSPSHSPVHANTCGPSLCVVGSRESRKVDQAEVTFSECLGLLRVWARVCGEAQGVRWKTFVSRLLNPSRTWTCFPLRNLSRLSGRTAPWLRIPAQETWVDMATLSALARCTHSPAPPHTAAALLSPFSPPPPTNYSHSHPPPTPTHSHPPAPFTTHPTTQPALYTSKFGETCCIELQG